MEFNMVDFREMPYERPDMEQVTHCYESVIEKLNNASSYEEARDAFFFLQEEEKKAETMISLCSVRNTIDTTDEYYAAEIKWLREQSAALIPLRKQYRQALASSPFRGNFEQEFGTQLLRMIDASLKTADEKIIADTIRESELSQQYQKDSA